MILWLDIDILKLDIDILRLDTDILRLDINILWLDIDILRLDIDILRPDINILMPDIDILWLYINILRLDQRATEWQLALAPVFVLLTKSIFPDFCKILFLHPVNLHLTALSVNACWRNIVQKHIIFIKSGSFLLYFLCRFCISISIYSHKLLFSSLKISLSSLKISI